MSDNRVESPDVPQPMLESYAKQVGSAHNQLMEGAITFVEFFNFVVAKASVLLADEEFLKEHDAAQKEMDSWKVENDEKDGGSIPK